MHRLLWFQNQPTPRNSRENATYSHHAACKLTCVNPFYAPLCDTTMKRRRRGEGGRRTQVSEVNRGHCRVSGSGQAVLEAGRYLRGAVPPLRPAHRVLERRSLPPVPGVRPAGAEPAVRPGLRRVVQVGRNLPGPAGRGRPPVALKEQRRAASPAACTCPTQAPPHGRAARPIRPGRPTGPRSPRQTGPASAAGRRRRGWYRRSRRRCSTDCRR
jgi:hypothetical protein